MPLDCLGDTMTDNNNNRLTIDPQLKESLSNINQEDPLLTEYGTPGKSNADRPQFEITEQWFPQPDDWQGKTRIHPRQAQALAAARILPKAFDDLEPIEEYLIDMINNYEMYLTSVDGKSREEQTRVLEAMFGEDPELTEGGNALMSMFAQAEDSED